MEEFIAALNTDYRLDKYYVKDKLAVFYVSSKLKNIACPYCGTISSKVHSSYEREVQDLPMQNRKVVLLIKTRRIFCMNNKCKKKTFSERHSFVDLNGKKTTRLIQNILYTSTQLSSINAANILKSNSIEVSKSSVCSLLKKMPSIVDKSSVKKVCVDDFALRKRFSYGT